MIITVFVFSDKNFAAPELGCLITSISTFIDKILFAVSTNVSPFFKLELPAVKFTISAESLFSASSNESFVLVLFSKNKLAMVISLSVGTFLIGLFITSLKLSAVLKIRSISDLVKSLIPSKCDILNSLIFKLVNTIIFGLFHVLLSKEQLLFLL